MGSCQRFQAQWSLIQHEHSRWYCWSDKKIVSLLSSLSLSSLSYLTDFPLFYSTLVIVFQDLNCFCIIVIDHIFFLVFCFVFLWSSYFRAYVVFSVEKSDRGFSNGLKKKLFSFLFFLIFNQQNKNDIQIFSILVWQTRFHSINSAHISIIGKTWLRQSNILLRALYWEKFAVTECST